MELCINNTGATKSILTDRKYYINQEDSTLKNFNNSFEFPSYGFYNSVSFSGGKSLDLEETKNRLDELGANFPVGIKEEVERTLSNGNPESKTLIEIQKDYYSVLEDCKTLDDVKEIYPEFSDVKSDSDVPVREGTFISEVKKGKIEGFSSDTDVSLQLLRLYWGQGFSFTTLTDNYKGTNFFKLFDKLNIPTADFRYAKYLKLSDKDYNERFSSYITEKAQQNRLAKLNQQVSSEVIEKNEEVSENVNIPENEEILENEITVQNAEEIKSVNKNRSIPQNINSTLILDNEKVTQRVPMSDEQRQSISKGLTEHYKAYPMSEDQKKAIALGVTKFFELHPEKTKEMSLIFSQVLLRAWNYEEGLEVRKKMSKFMQKNSIDTEIAEKLRSKKVNEDDVDLNKLITDNRFRTFWKCNPESRKLFSKSMIKSWDRQRQLSEVRIVYEPIYECSCIPKGLQGEFSRKIPGFNNHTGKIYIPDLREGGDSIRNGKGSILCGIKELSEADSDYLAAIDSCIVLSLMELSKNPDVVGKEYLDAINNFAKGENIKQRNILLYSVLVDTSVRNGDTEVTKLLKENLDNAYEQTRNMNPLERIKYSARIAKQLEKNPDSQTSQLSSFIWNRLQLPFGIKPKHNVNIENMYNFDIPKEAIERLLNFYRSK